MTSLAEKISSLWRKGAQNPLYRRMANGAFWSLAAALCTNLGNLFVGFMLVHILGKFAYGQYGMLRSTVNLFLAFSALSLGATATKYVAEFRESDKARTGRIISLSLLYGLVLAAVCGTVCFAGADFLARENLNSPEMAGILRLGSLMIFLAAMNSVLIGVLSGFEDFSNISIVNMIGALTFICGSFAGSRLAELQGAVLALSLYILSMIIAALHFLRKRLKSDGIPLDFRNCGQEFRCLLQFSLPTALVGLLVTPVLWYGNTLLVKSPAGYGGMAGYDLLNQWKMAVLFIPGIVGRIALPMLSNLNGEKQQEDYFKMLKINLWINVGVTILAAAVLSLASPLILRSYGSGFTEYTGAFVLMMAAAVFFAANTIIGQVILSKGMAWTGCFFNFLWAVSFIGFTHYFVTLRNQGVWGISLAFLLSYCCHTLWQYGFLYCFFKKGKDAYDS